MLVMTERLVLVPLDVAQARLVRAGGVADGRRPVEWGAGYPDEGDVASAGMYLSQVQVAGCDVQPWGPYKVVCSADGRVIGTIGFHHPPDADGAVEVGFDIAAPARGNGYAGEALRAMIGHARDLGAYRVIGRCEPGNEPSLHVQRGAGMRELGTEAGLVDFAIDLH